MQTLEDVVKLREEIAASFAAREYPGNENIVSCNRGPCPECTEVRDFYNKYHWRDIPNPEFWTSMTIMQPGALLSKEAFRFFIPGLMIAGLADHDKAAEVISSLLFMLSREENERLCNFTFQERSAISKFLRFLKNETLWAHDKDIDRAIALLTSGKMCE